MAISHLRTLHNAEMIKRLREHISPVIVIVGIPLSVVAFIFFWHWKSIENKFTSEMASYKETQLPPSPLIELNSGDDYSGKIKDNDVLLVFSTTGCAACEKELQTVTENAAEIKSGLKVYSVMFEDRKIVYQYVQKHHLNFPILLDEDGRLLKKLHLKYFPSNLKLRDGVIKEAWFGIASDEEDFLKRISFYQR